MNEGESNVQSSVEGGDEGSQPVTPQADPAGGRSALEAKVSQGLAALRDTETGEDSSASESDAESDEVAEESEESSEEGAEPESEDAPEESKTEEQQPKAKPKSSKAPTFPDALRRTLKAYEWSDEEIDRAHAENPANFLLTAQKIHANRSKELAGWAEMGRKARQTEQAPTNVKGTATEAASHVDPETGLFRPIDVDSMVEKFGNEDLVRQIVAPVNEVLGRINSLLPDLMTGVDTIQESRKQSLKGQIDSFFGSKELERYVELYGKGDLSDAHMQARNKVLETADALISGAKSQGRSLTVAEALMAAHDVLSVGHKTQAIRSEIKKSVVSRNKGLTLRPSSAGGNPDKGPPKDKDALEKRTRDRLSKVFG